MMTTAIKFALLLFVAASCVLMKFASANILLGSCSLSCDNEESDISDIDLSRPLRGLPGVQGKRGPAGPKGSRGLQGVSGPTGASGDKGELGPAGSKGSQGLQGVPGSTGTSGVKGERGPAGRRGSRGLQGVSGPTGAPGDSCDCSFRDKFQEELEKLKASIKELMGSPGWFRGKNGLYYKFVEEKLNYNNAKTKCGEWREDICGWVWTILVFLTDWFGLMMYLEPVKTEIGERMSPIEAQVLCIDIL